MGEIPAERRNARDQLQFRRQEQPGRGARRSLEAKLQREICLKPQSEQPVDGQVRRCGQLAKSINLPGDVPDLGRHFHFLGLCDFSPPDKTGAGAIGHTERAHVVRVLDGRRELDRSAQANLSAQFHRRRDQDTRGDDDRRKVEGNQMEGNTHADFLLQDKVSTQLEAGIDIEMQRLERSVRNADIEFRSEQQLGSERDLRMILRMLEKEFRRRERALPLGFGCRLVFQTQQVRRILPTEEDLSGRAVTELDGPAILVNNRFQMAGQIQVDARAFDDIAFRIKDLVADRQGLDGGEHVQVHLGIHLIILIAHRLTGQNLVHAALREDFGRMVEDQPVADGRVQILVDHQFQAFGINLLAVHVITGVSVFVHQLTVLIHINHANLLHGLGRQQDGAIVPLCLRPRRVIPCRDVSDGIYGAAIEGFSGGLTDCPDGFAAFFIDERDLEALLILAGRDNQEYRLHGAGEIRQAIAQVKRQDRAGSGNLRRRCGARSEFHPARHRCAGEVAELHTFHHCFRFEDLTDLQYSQHAAERQAATFRTVCNQDVGSRIRRGHGIRRHVVLRRREFNHDSPVRTGSALLPGGIGGQFPGRDCPVGAEIGRLPVFRQISFRHLEIDVSCIGAEHADLIAGLPNRLQANARNVEQLRLGNGQILFDDRAQAVLV